MTKNEARKYFFNERINITTTKKNRQDDLMLINFQTLPLPYLYYVHTYLAVNEKNEFETDHLLHYLEFKNPELKIVIPKVQNDELIHIEYTDSVVIKNNSWGIPEPQNGDKIDEKLIDLILVPLLAFDQKGYRVGYGKGYYDKFLAKCRSDAIKIGLSYFEAIDAIIDTEQFDIPLNYCITPQRIYEFG